MQQTKAVFKIVPYSLTHYSLYSGYDIVNYIGKEQPRIRTLVKNNMGVTCREHHMFTQMWGILLSTI